MTKRYPIGALDVIVLGDQPRQISETLANLELTDTPNANLRVVSPLPLLSQVFQYISQLPAHLTKYHFLAILRK